ncbi:unnamed protein product [Clonostachys solani]|uniref:Heterokaryon incompatibility domain-containing protein n=1 Tax=Clonostachys solani TaxID=160281 RepID=A0A9P0EF06_9HYPO|nr:unnamed protein product [Clonostachys solani]
MQTCHACKGLDESLPLSQGISLPELASVAAQGCDTCDLLCRSIEAIGEAEAEERSLRLGWDTNRIQGLRVVVGRHDTGQFLYSIDMSPCSGRENRVPWTRPKAGEKPIEISGDTSSEAASLAIKEWLEMCTSSHQCRKTTPVFLPTRILDVRNLNHIYLHCAEPGEEGQYACLSHCWGTEQTMKTTSANLTLHRDDIPWQEMPQTFREAAQVAFSLGIPYLWIDSLCIIQDSKEDWQKESAKMASIYANSLLTIAASLAAADDKGLFSKSPEFHRSQIIETRAKPGSQVCMMQVRKTLTHGHGPSPLPLMRRAWVLQERLLSPRVIHFLPEELVWECMESTSCECGCIRSLWSPGHEPFLKDLLHEMVLSKLSLAEVRAQWHRLVREYSRLELTFHTDRLPAVSGAARKFSSFFQCQYLAGMWRTGLLRDLIWERKSAIAGSKRLTYIPTWSWASIIGAQIVVDEAMATDDLAVVLDAKCSLVMGAGEFGEVSGGILTLSGVLSHISISYSVQGEAVISVMNTEESQIPRETYFKYIPDTEGVQHSGPGLVAIQAVLRRGVYDSERDEEIWFVLRLVEGGAQRYQRVGLLKMEPGAMELGEISSVHIV